MLRSGKPVWTGRGGRLSRKLASTASKVSRFVSSSDSWPPKTYPKEQKRTSKDYDFTGIMLIDSYFTTIVDVYLLSGEDQDHLDLSIFSTRFEFESRCILVLVEMS